VAELMARIALALPTRGARAATRCGSRTPAWPALCTCSWRGKGVPREAADWPRATWASAGALAERAECIRENAVCSKNTRCNSSAWHPIIAGAGKDRDAGGPTSRSGCWTGVTAMVNAGFSRPFSPRS
jgi:hypothetical protein